jgi:hypothetical protein
MANVLITEGQLEFLLEASVQYYTTRIHDWRDRDPEEVALWWPEGHKAHLDMLVNARADCVRIADHAGLDVEDMKDAFGL